MADPELAYLHKMLMTPRFWVELSSLIQAKWRRGFGWEATMGCFLCESGLGPREGYAQITDFKICYPCLHGVVQTMDDEVVKKDG